LSLDSQLFYLINVKLANSFFDWLMPLATDLHKNKLFLFFALPAGFAYWIYKQRGNSFLKIVFMVLMIAALDNFNHRVIKNYFQRQRPPLVEKEYQLRSPHHGGFSFPSNHAANMFAGATFLRSCYPALTIPLYLIATTVAYSRVYVGVHYPLDVLVGGILGFLFGLLFFRIFAIINNKLSVKE
jgi:undecaprenyl-diphosphatase